MVSRAVVAVLALVLNSGCTNLFLQPDRLNYFPDINKHFLVEEGEIPAANGAMLSYWLLPAQLKKKMSPSKGLVVQFHGNAQNLSSHVHTLAWLPAAGYDLLIIDYQGYGQSTGKATIDAAYSDVLTALDFVFDRWAGQKRPILLYGQSLGGTLLLKAVSRHPRRWTPKLVVIEASFFSFGQIAREKMRGAWLTWPLQWMPYLVISDRYSLKAEELATIAPTPVLLFHSANDPIVPAHNAEQIFSALAEPKEIHRFKEPGHIHAMWVQKGRFRQVLLDYIAKTP